MDALRQRWHDIVTPKLRKARWFLALWFVLALVAIPWGVRAEERGLEAATATALADAGVTVEDIAFTGRNAVISATLTATDRTKAEAALGEVDGIRSIDWQIAPAVEPPPVTTPPVTTTTTIPPARSATLNFKVRLGLITLGGQLPEAHQVAELASAAEMAYGTDVINRLSAGDVVAPDWFDRADRLVASLGLVGAAEIALDGVGISGTALAPTDGAADALGELLDGFADAGASVDVAISVSEGETVALSISDDGDVVTVAGALYRASFIEELEALVAPPDGAFEGGIRLNKSLAPAFAVTRLDDLVQILVGAEQWSLSYENEALSGEWVGKGLFPRDPDKPPTATAVDLVDEIAALMVGDPRLELTIEVGSVVRNNGSTDAEMARLRAAAIAVALIRRGVDPDRITAGGIDEGEVLRFLLEPAER